MLHWQSSRTRKLETLISQALVYLPSQYPGTCWPLYWVASSGASVCSRITLQHTTQKCSPSRVFCHQINPPHRRVPRVCLSPKSGLSQQKNRGWNLRSQECVFQKQASEAKSCIFNTVWNQGRVYIPRSDRAVEEWEKYKIWGSDIVGSWHRTVCSTHRHKAKSLKDWHIIPM